jgi:hypothetical protein
MPLPLTTEARAALRTREVAVAWLLELTTDEGVLRAWDKTEALTYEAVTWEPLADAWGIEGEIRAGADLVAEPLTIWFDGARQLEDSSFVGRLLDRTWHQRAVRLRQLLLVPESNFATVIGVTLDWRGHMDQISAPEGEAAASRVVLSCESGTFRARGRNLHTVTDADQRLRDDADASFRNMAVKPFQDVPFGTSWANIPGARSSGSGGGSGGGGGNGLQSVDI